MSAASPLDKIAAITDHALENVELLGLALLHSTLLLRQVNQAVGGNAEIQEAIDQNTALLARVGRPR